METLLVVLVAAAVPIGITLIRYAPYLFRLERRADPAQQAEMWRSFHEAYVQGLEAGRKRP